MFGSNNRSAYSDGGKTSGFSARRLPVFSIVLVACYVVVSALFFVYGFGDGRKPPAQPEEPAPTAAPSPTPAATATPTPSPPAEFPPAVKVKGIYIYAWYAVDAESGGVDLKKFDEYIELCETTEVNAFVIDVKDNNGHVTFPTDNEMFAVERAIVIPTMGEFVADLKSRGIYTIARVVCFDDPIRAKRNPQFAICDSAGDRLSDKKGRGWLDPYKKENWDYIAEICLEAARLGFEEIQLDYVRFPTGASFNTSHYGADGEGKTKTQVIAEFITFIRDKLAEVGVRISADVFGIIALSDNDANYLGQDLELLLPNVDYISPMIYPSHFANKKQNGQGQYINNILFEAPDTEPYDVILNILKCFERRMDSEDPSQAIMRPFLQGFTADYLGEGYFLKYGADEIRAQINAVYEAGFEEWIIWEHSSRYSADAFE